MSKGKKILIGIATLWPGIYIYSFIGYASSTDFTSILGSDKGSGLSFLTLFVLHSLTASYIFILIAAYIYYVFEKEKIPKEKKVIWAIIIVFGNIVAMPVFWFLYIWKEPKIDKWTDPL